MPILDKDRKARANYRKKVEKVQFELFPSDKDIKERLAWAKENEGKASYIKRLIREDMKKS